MTIKGRAGVEQVSTTRPEPTSRVTLVTADGVRIDAAFDAFTGPADTSERSLSFVVVHGFTGSWRWPTVRAVAHGLTAYGDVLSIDLRGHGQSGGLSTLGDREVLDVDAAVAWLRARGRTTVVTVGFSLGAAVVTRHGGLTSRPASHGSDREYAALLTSPVDGVVSVSGTAFWYYRGTAPMRLLHLVALTWWGRAVVRLTRRLRISAVPWDADDPPTTPTTSVAAIAVPLLIVHGDADPYFPLEHPRALAAAASAGVNPGGVTVWIEPGMGHAESATSGSLVDRIGTWAAGVTA